MKQRTPIKEMINALDRYYIEGVKQTEILSNILQRKTFIQDYTQLIYF